MRVLVTGFSPFGAHDSNPSDAVARALDGVEIEGFTFVAVSPLPVVYERAAELALSAAERARADAVLALGLSDGARRLRVEQRAMNLCTSRNEDSTGATRQGLVAIEGGSAELETSIDVDVVVHTLQQLGVDAERSESAGGYVCNDLYYRLLASDKSATPKPILFVHLPKRAASHRQLPEVLARAFVTAVRTEPGTDDERPSSDDLGSSLREERAFEVGEAAASRTHEITGREIVRCFRYRDIAVAAVAAGGEGRNDDFSPEVPKHFLDSLEDAFRRTTGPTEVRLHAAVLRATSRFRDRGGAPASDSTDAGRTPFVTVIALACDGESYFVEWVGNHSLYVVSDDDAICKVPSHGAPDAEHRRIEPERDLVVSSLLSFAQLAARERLVLLSASVAERIESDALLALAREASSCDGLAKQILAHVGPNVPHAAICVLRPVR